MPTTLPPNQSETPSAPSSSPVGTSGPRVPLYSPEFSSDPHRIYREMRERYGSLVPVDLAPGVPATLVIGYHQALRILNDPDHFPADPRVWEKNVPDDCPVPPILRWRPTALHSDGAVHARYRQATSASLAGVDLHAVHNTVERIAASLINVFCETGSADLISQYAFPLAFAAVNDMVGCSARIGQQVAAGMAAFFEGVEEKKGLEVFTEALSELVALKRAHPGDDVTTRLLHHPADLDDMEVVQQVANLYAGNIELQQNLITNTLLLILTDDRFAGGVLSGCLQTRDALDELLFNDPPLANHCPSYPRRPILIDDIWLPAHQPVIISITGCNNDPAVNTGAHAGNRSHLAWGAGPHRCPAQTMATLIAQDAVDQLLDALPDIQLAVPTAQLTWRPGSFHRALTSLPVIFPAASPLNGG
ncbi:cytochrome P450 [Nocardia nova]|uniref:cytochrome P450 n=1 Tax=Nocardia nova TaxID=37330 RepID=UPI000A48D811|nr:cytochrome P450 [Nocardia nova]